MYHKSVFYSVLYGRLLQTMTASAKMTSKPSDSNPKFCSQRWILAYVGFSYLTVSCALRMNFSLAIVCMVKDNNVSTQAIDANSTVSTCTLSTRQNLTTKPGEFDWSRSVRSSLLASFFYGYICTQIPGGWLADRFGGRVVLGISMLVASVVTVVLPILARTSVALVFAARVILGLSFGVTYPCLQSVLGRWAPPLERSQLFAFTFFGSSFGNAFVLGTAGFLCDYNQVNGWAWIFYISGGAALLQVVLWFYLSADTPGQHPRITEAERKYIEHNIEFNTTKRAKTLPWIPMLTSKAVWASVTAHVCFNWSEYTIYTFLPTFLEEVFMIDVTSNGLLSAAAYMSQGLVGLIAGHAADKIRSKRWLTTTSTRKTCQIMSLLGAGVFLIATGSTSCSDRYMALVLLLTAISFFGLSRAGYDVNPLDYAPMYAGTVYGISNTLSTIPGMVAPIMAGALTYRKTQEEWRNVFYVCAGFDVLGSLVYGICASGKLQKWATDEIDNKPNKGQPHVYTVQLDTRS